MTSKPLFLRDPARQDIEDAVDHYRRDAGQRVAQGFLAALERAFSAIVRNPAIGSPRHAYELELPGLRCWGLGRYPYLIFYVERAQRIEVWRLLHGRRDIPAWMNEPEPV